jgi:hypothetical protein
MRLLSPNLDQRGRLWRGLAGFAFVIAAPFAFLLSRVAAAACAVSALFLFLEAARGWCAFRACGIRTRL